MGKGRGRRWGGGVMGKVGWIDGEKGGGGGGAELLPSRLEACNFLLFLVISVEGTLNAARRSPGKSGAGVSESPRSVNTDF